MAKNNGFIKINRNILYGPVWESDEIFDLRSVYLDLTLRATHSEKRKVQGAYVYTLMPGQLTGSQRQFGEWWNMDKCTAMKRLHCLQDLGLINIDTSTTPQTLITLVNYCSEQGKNGLGTDSNSDSNSDSYSDNVSDKVSDKVSEHYKNDKECIKNDKECKEAPSAEASPSFPWREK